MQPLFSRVEAVSLDRLLYWDVNFSFAGNKIDNIEL